MINEIVSACDLDLSHDLPHDVASLKSGDAWLANKALARMITGLEAGSVPAKLRDALLREAEASNAPVLGITGTGGAGKSSLTDELIRRFRLDQDDRLRIAIISIDPSRRKSGGALLGDRIRMNAIHSPGRQSSIYMRSLATRDAASEISRALPDAVAACKAAGYDLIVVETSGIGQGDAAIVPHVDLSLYVMTPEFGAASQLEKIDMLDFADFVAINKFDRKGAADALRDVRKQYQRNRELFRQRPDEMPVYGTIAARFNDDGVTALYQALAARLGERGLKLGAGKLPSVNSKHSTRQHAVVPASRVRYLAEIAESVRGYHAWAKAQAKIARERQQLRGARAMLSSSRATTGDTSAEASGSSSPRKRGPSGVATDPTTLDSRFRGNDEGGVSRANDEGEVSRGNDEGGVSRGNDEGGVSRASDEGEVSRGNDEGGVQRANDEGEVSRGDQDALSRTRDEDAVSSNSDEAAALRRNEGAQAHQQLDSLIAARDAASTRARRISSKHGRRQNPPTPATNTSSKSAARKFAAR